VNRSSQPSAISTKQLIAHILPLTAAVCSSRHPGLDPGSSKSSLLSAKSYSWISDSSEMTSGEPQLSAISDKLLEADHSYLITDRFFTPSRHPGLDPGSSIDCQLLDKGFIWIPFSKGMTR